MKWQLVNAPPTWYVLFWVSMLFGLFFVIKYAVIAAWLWLKIHGKL